jgi:hypothetical protein
LRKRELQDIVNFDLRWEQVQRKNAQERAQYLANEKRDLITAIEVLVTSLGIRDNYLVEDQWDSSRMIFDSAQLVDDLLAMQDEREDRDKRVARQIRLSKSSKGNPEK